MFRSAGPAPASSPLTIEAWVAVISSPNAYSTMLGQGDASANGLFLLTNSAASALQYSVHDPGVALFTAGIPLLSGWHLFHLVRTTNAGTSGALELYIDGVQAFYSSPQTIAAGASTITVNGQGASNYDNALYDEVAVYDFALSQARMLAHLHAAGAVSGAPLGSASGVQLQTSVAALTDLLNEILAAVKKTY